MHVRYNPLLNEQHATTAPANMHNNRSRHHSMPCTHMCAALPAQQTEGGVVQHGSITPRSARRGRRGRRGRLAPRAAWHAHSMACTAGPRLPAPQQRRRHTTPPPSLHAVTALQRCRGYGSCSAPPCFYPVPYPHALTAPPHTPCHRCSTSPRSSPARMHAHMHTRACMHERIRQRAAPRSGRRPGQARPGQMRSMPAYPPSIRLHPPWHRTHSAPH